MSALPASGSARIGSLHVYPVKSAAGIELERAALTSAGIAEDRRWMLVGPGGAFLTQRELPQMACIRPRVGDDALYVDAPGMPSLRLPLQHAEAPELQVTIWETPVAASDCGDDSARWFSEVTKEDFDSIWAEIARP